MGLGQMTYTVGGDIAWVRDGDTCILVARGSTRAWVLAGAEALIWSLLMLGHSPAEIASTLGQASGLARPEAQGRLEATLRGWAGEGILRVGVDRG
jgi:hypothetical protein